MRKVWIEVALNGAWSRKLQPRIPDTVEAIVADGIACARAGAAIVHTHAYQDGKHVFDWQVYARNDRYFVRQYEEETNLQATIALDTSGSMGFGLSTVSKFEYARRAAACLARLLLPRSTHRIRVPRGCDNPHRLALDACDSCGDPMTARSSSGSRSARRRRRCCRRA